MNYATHYDIGERKRETGINEDSVAVSVFEEGHREGYRGRTEPVGDAERPATRSAAVLVLADGAGGHDAGDAASYIASTTIAAELVPVAIEAASADAEAFDVDISAGSRDERTTSPKRQPSPAEMRGAIEDAIQVAHRDIVAHAAETGAGAYTTVVAGIALDGTFHYGWVGDSRAYVLNTDHEHLARLTEDHAVVEQLQAEGEVDEVEAHVHPRGNEITRALGGPGDPDSASVDVESATVPLFAEDVLLVTSDGLPDAQTDAPDLYDEYVATDRSPEAAATVRERVVTDEDIREWVLGADSLGDAAATLVSEANDRGGKDNLSVLLCQDPTLEATPPELPVRARDPHPVQTRDTVVLSED